MGYTILTGNGNILPISPLGGGGDITILNEDVVIADKVKRINFIGSDVSAVVDALDPFQVNVSVPISLQSSFYNTNTGINSATVPNIATANRNIANPKGVYDIGDWVVPTSRPCTNNASITYTNANFFSILNNTGTTFTAEVLGADGTTVLATHSITITGNSDTTVNNIRINLTGFSVEETKYKAKVSVTVNLNAIIPQGGRFSIKLTHNNGADGIFTKTQNNIFYDSDVNPPVISNPTFSINTPIFKYISGVKYYTKGTTVNVGIGNLNYLNDRSYPNIQSQIIGTNIGTPQINLAGADLSGWNNDYDNINSSYSKTDWTITTDNLYKKENVFVQARWIDWSNNALQDSISQPLLIDTYLQNRTRIVEDFNNESFRLKKDYTIWDSTQKINTYTNNTDALQLENSALIYPQNSFTSFNPDTASQPDYTGLTGNRQFISYFFFTGTSKSNGIFSLGSHNITETDITNNDFKLEISLNGTDWFNCNESYFGGTLLNGDGCRIDNLNYNLSNNRIRFTLSTFFTSNSTGSSIGGYWGLFFRITYADTIRGKELSIGSISILDWI